MTAAPLGAETRGQPGAVDYGMLVTLSALWGSSFLFIKLGVDTVPALSVTAARLTVAAVFLAVVAVHAKQAIPRGAGLWRLIVLSALFGNALPFSLIAWGEEAIDSGLAAILMAVMPLTTVLLAHVFTRDEKLTLGKAAGVGLGLAGLVVLIGPEKLARLGEDTVRQLAVAGAAFCYGLNAIITRGLAGQPRRALAAALMVSSTAMLLPACLIVDRPWALAPSTTSLAAIVGLAVLHTAGGTLIMLAIIRRQGASFFSQINFMVPLFGVLWGALVLFERPPPQAYAALALILLGIAVTRGRRRAAQAAKPGQP